MKRSEWINVAIHRGGSNTQETPALMYSKTTAMIGKNKRRQCTIDISAKTASRMGLDKGTKLQTLYIPILNGGGIKMRIARDKEGSHTLHKLSDTKFSYRFTLGEQMATAFPEGRIIARGITFKQSAGGRVLAEFLIPPVGGK